MSWVLLFRCRHTEAPPSRLDRLLLWDLRIFFRFLERLTALQTKSGNTDCRQTRHCDGQQILVHQLGELCHIEDSISWARLTSRSTPFEILRRELESRDCSGPLLSSYDKSGGIRWKSGMDWTWKKGLDLTRKFFSKHCQILKSENGYILFL